MYTCVFEDSQIRNFLPLVYFRPVYELRCGTMSLREKIESFIPRSAVTLHMRDILAEYYREEYPDRSINNIPDGDVWCINGRLLADENLSKLFRAKFSSAKVFLKDDEIVAAFVDRGNLKAIKERFSNGSSIEDILKELPFDSFPGRLMHYPWDLVYHTAEEIEKDFQHLKTKLRGKDILGKVHSGTHLLNKKNIFIGENSIIKPGVVLDAEKGPIIIGKNVTIMPNAFIEGPAYIGDNSIIKVGAKIYHGTSIGAHCKVGGEVDASVIQSYSNKQHDGFLGHSYLGSWVNIGADTNTSDLKNTYGNVKVTVNGELIDSGLQFVGLTMGDHSKTGINVMFDTGTVVGVSCNVYGAGLPPKYLPSFSWGGEQSFSTYELEKSLATMQRVMARRGVQMTAAYEKIVRNVFEETTSERRNKSIV